MSTKAKNTHSEAPGQSEGHNQATGGEAARRSNESREEEMPSKGWSEKHAETLCDRLLCEATEAPAEQRNEILVPAGGVVGGGGSDRPAAPIFTPPPTRNEARKKETRRRLTKSSAWE